LFIIVGFLIVGIAAVVTLFDVYKSIKMRNNPPTPIPIFDTSMSTREISEQMVRFVCDDVFLMHVSENNPLSRSFDDDGNRKKYKRFIENRSVTDYIQNLKGGLGYE
jgi:hypothetical protein